MPATEEQRYHQRGNGDDADVLPIEECRPNFIPEYSMVNRPPVPARLPAIAGDGDRPAARVTTQRIAEINTHRCAPVIDDIGQLLNEPACATTPIRKTKNTS